MEIRSNLAIDLWNKAINFIMNQGKDYIDNQKRNCREVFNLVLTIDGPDDAKIDQPIDKISSKRRWVYPGKEELSSIMFKETNAPIYEYTYGGRMYNYQGRLDQLNSYIIPLLKKDITTRRAIITIADPTTDSEITNKNSPGLVSIHFLAREGRLNVSCLIRSNDLFFGWPANIYQLHVLQKQVAKELGIECGSITTISSSAHVFLEDLEDIKEVLS